MGFNVAMKRWNILSEYISKVPLVEQILKNRGVADIQEFLSPPPVSNYFDKLSPELRSNFDQAKNIIENAIDQNITIVVYGDYDVDGICSTAILYNTIKKELGYQNILFFIPNRFEHGYGLSKNAISDLNQKYNIGRSLFIMVDTGITAHGEIKILKEMGHKVIVIDHHQKMKHENAEILPQADCLVWSDNVVASTLSWLLSKYLGSKDKKNISLAALATVTDVQPLLGFNRTIVKAGLNILNSDPPAGIRELMKVAGKEGSEITTYDLGWVIGPRVNASGRLVSADDSLSLFIDDDSDNISQVAQKLNSLNEDRQDKTQSMYELASTIETGELPKIIFSESEDYHEGIIGLIAAKLVQKYYRPAVVVSLSGGFGKGSVRSIKGFDVISFLRKFEPLFINLGGHPMAAGFSIEESRLAELKQKIFECVDDYISDEILIPDLMIDLNIPIDMVDVGIFKELEKMKPFGMGNDEPVFLSGDLGIAEINTIGKENQHVRFKLFKNGKYYKAIYFDSSEKTRDLEFGDKIDVVYTVKRNEYNGNTYLDLVVKDLKKAGTRHV
jgi:single-stranded-DNA-specific exonuclease